MTDTAFETPDRLVGDRDQIMAMNRALIAAQKKLRVIGKDARNNHGKFNYTTADSMIQACADALHECGLAVIPGGSTAHELSGKPYLRMELELIHEGGASRQCSRDWPIQAAGAQNMVRAAAVTETSALSYFYRTLLALKRADKDDMNDPSHDRAASRQRRQAAQPKTPMVGLGKSTLGGEILARLDGVTDPDGFRKASSYVSGLIDRRDSGEDVGLTDGDVDALVSRMQSLQAEFSE